ncbi:MAG TPA: IS200/IS605 family transposase [Phnomibacter sp.]|nr:IS200/IS605 family transposase [Phnomibacter sp.]
MGTYRQIYLHLVFGTKYREPTILEEHEKELYKYIWGIVEGHQCKLYRINGMPDHIHIFSDLHPSVSIDNYVKDIKIASNKWMKESGLFPDFKAWQSGYGAFTIHHSRKDSLIEYIINQKEHHKVETFEAEYQRLLIEHGIRFRPEFLFD